jgi:hypothetical protein
MKHALALAACLSLLWSAWGLADAAASAPAGQPGALRILETGATVDGSTRYLADAGRPAKPCTFEILIGKSKPAGGGLFGFAPASLIRRPAADCAPFLKELAPHLGFKGKLPAPRSEDRLVASVAVLGTNQSRVTKSPKVAGGFSSEPPGNWTVMKLFLADGEGEVFLNVNAADHIGEFSTKDEDYATVVITELAKILLRRAA